MGGERYRTYRARGGNGVPEVLELPHRAIDAVEAETSALTARDLCSNSKTPRHCPDQAAAEAEISSHPTEVASINVSNGSMPSPLVAKEGDGLRIPRSGGRERAIEPLQLVRRSAPEDILHPARSGRQNRREPRQTANPRAHGVA